MAKLTKDTLFKAAKPRAETLIDRTTRAAKQILEDEAEQRERKTARLRKARLERTGDLPGDAPKPPSKSGHKT